MTTAQESWAAKLARDIAFAETMLTTRGSLNPMFIIEAGGERFITECRFADPTSKDAAMQFVQLWAVSVDADAITSLSEAWLSTPPIGTTQDVALTMVPATDPARKEVVVAVAVYRDGDQRRCLQATHQIERNAKGRVTGLGLNLTEGEADAMGGNFANLLPASRPSCEQRAHAKAVFDDLPFFMRRAITPKPIKH
jgi:hypothetical protein